MNKIKRMQQQTEIIENMQVLGFNVLTCASCGSVFITQEGLNYDDNTGYSICPHCLENGEDHMDYYYEGWELSPCEDDNVQPRKPRFSYSDIKNKAHNHNGIENPYSYLWEESNGIYYPVKDISDLYGKK